MKKLFQVLLLNLLFFQILLAQDKEVNSFTIGQVVFEGHKKNKLSYLYNNIDAKKGQPTSQSLFENDVQRLKNLNGIANASSISDTVGQQINVTYRIQERKTQLPIINFGGIENNVWFKLGLIDNNLFGKGHSLLAFYQNTDGRHTGHVFYRNPNINNSRWGYSFSINKWSSIEPVFFPEATVSYLYDNNGLNLSGLYQFSNRRNTELGLTFFRETYRKEKEYIEQDTPGPDEFAQNKWLFKFAYNENFLNYHIHYITGYDWGILGQSVYNTVDKNWFNSIKFQSRFFARPHKYLNVAARVIFAIATNNDTPFAPYVLDSHVNIRGVGNRIDRGTAQAFINLEVRQTIFQVNNWASQIVVFSDLGTWRNPGGDLEQLLDPDQFQHYVGAGLRLAYLKVYGATLRIDYGFNIYNKKEKGFVLGLGQYF